LRWFDSASTAADAGPQGADRVDWARILPFAGMHLACLGVIWVGVSPVAVGTAVGLYVMRMFAITGFYHRYFSHRTFKASRGVQFAFALLGASAAQRGPIWWAAHHRHHHAHSDRPEDVHSPSQRGFLWSHMGWFLSRRHFALEARWPSLGTSGGQMLVWGFFISTVACYHGTYTINSLCHVWGRRRYKTDDDSRNNLLLAIITLGEGWHNNHHRYPMSARQGFYWWEIDLTYYGLRLLAVLGLIRDLKPVPAAIRAAHNAVTP
jgi:stearoyl-CoA desaturase (delta-9 desaturase)